MHHYFCKFIFAIQDYCFIEPDKIIPSELSLQMSILLYSILINLCHVINTTMSTSV